MNPIKSPQLQTATYEFVNMKGMVSLFTCTDNVCIRFSSGIVENIAVHVLFGTSFIDRCIRMILATEQKIVPWQAVPTIVTKTEINPITANDTILIVSTISSNDALHEKFNLYRIERQITISTYMQEVVLVSC